MPRKPLLEIVPKDEPVGQEEADYLAVAVTEEEAAEIVTRNAVEKAPHRPHPRIGGDAIPRPFDALPRPWMQALLDHAAAASTIRLLLALLSHTDRKTRHSVTVTDRVMADARIHFSRKRRALEVLEAIGILAIDWSRRGYPVAVLGEQAGEFIIVPRMWRPALLSLDSGAALRLALLLLSLVRYRPLVPAASYRVTHRLLERRAHIRRRRRDEAVGSLQRLGLIEVIEPSSCRTEVRLLYLYDPRRPESLPTGTV